MRHVPSFYLRAGMLLGGLVVSASSLSQPVPTYAWRRVFNLYNGKDMATNFVTDISGNGIFQFTEDPGGIIGHYVVKISPANNVIFSEEVGMGAPFLATGITISPPVAGKQYVWATGVLDAHPLSNNAPLYMCYDITNASTAATTVASGFYPASAYGDVDVVGIQADAQGNLMMALSDAGSTGYRYLRLVTIDRTGTIISNSSNTEIAPGLTVWSPLAGGWIVTGADNISNQPFSGRWGIYNTSGTDLFGDHSDGFYDGNQMTVQRYVVNALPGGATGVIHNTRTSDGVSGTSTYAHTLQVRNANYSLAWNYPASGSSSGLGLQFASLSSSAPIYAVGNPDLSESGNQFVDKFNWTGTLLWHHTHQPVQKIFPTVEGFFGEEHYAPSHAIFLEHYVDATNLYDWGRSYTGTAAGEPTMGGFTSFQNFFYLANNVPNTTSGYDVITERFVTGIALSNVACASTVKQGTQLAVTINLNGNVGGSPMTVALNSSSAKLLLPNGTRGQNFSIPVGQNHITVMLNAQAVSSNTGVLLTAIQNGVRRTVVSTVTP